MMASDDWKRNCQATVFSSRSNSLKQTFVTLPDRFGDLDNSYVLPSYLRTDAAIYYQRNNWRAALNIKNLFDVEYFTGSDGGRVQVQPGAATVLEHFRWSFDMQLRKRHWLYTAI